jgi:DMSO/TMAO reductase YedYZ heme-binding membrane subunit
MHPPTLHAAAALLLLCIVYAAARYHVFGAVPWLDFLPFVLNKAVSLAGLILLSAAYLRKGNPAAARTLGVSGFALTCLHIAISVPLLGRRYYPKLFAGDLLTPAGEWSMITGLVSFLFLTAPALTSPKEMMAELGRGRWELMQRAGYWALAAGAVHQALIGFPGWFTPGHWPGYLPPITLLGAITALLPVIARLRRAVKERSATGGPDAG